LSRRANPNVTIRNFCIAVHDGWHDTAAVAAQARELVLVAFNAFGVRDVEQVRG
jgi:hypothetical protein